MSEADQTWMSKWFESVADGSIATSQRRLSSIEHNRASPPRPRPRGVHLAKLTDDEGNALIAANLHTFE